MHQTRFIVVTGGVLSGLGKGVITSCIGALLRAHGYTVTAIKMDPYINVDAGTMRPTEHGEVFVTDDGGETDQDLGNYERFMDEPILKANSVTTGQLYLTVIQQERNLKFDGKCVEVIPHIPLEIRRRILDVAEKTKADFVLIEVGGTVGDYQSILFLESLREMKRELNSMVFVHVAYLPTPGNIGEMKTKPAQHSVRFLNASGIQPDFIVARGEHLLDDIRKEKLSVFCNVKSERVIAAPDVKWIYSLPSMFAEQKFDRMLLEDFGLDYKDPDMKVWDDLMKNINASKESITIGVAGKYFDIGDFVLEDSYVSVIEAIKHACWNNNRMPNIVWLDTKDFEKDEKNLSKLDEVDALIVPGGFGASGVEGKIKVIQYAREHNIPFLGLCYGMQLAVVEYARNVCGLQGAHSSEVNKDTPNPVIDILDEQKELMEKSMYGATMRLGAYPAQLKAGTKVSGLYGSNEVSERHRHRYEVNPKYIQTLEDNGLVFSGYSPDRKLMEFLELPSHPYFVGTQAHPEFKSRPFRPAPLFDGLIKAAIGLKE